MRQHKVGGSHREVDSVGPAAGVPGKRTLTDELGAAPSVSAVAQTASAPVPHQGAMEASFGTSFGGVSAVAGTEPARSALDAVGANAATIGNKIVFADASPSPELVGHELAHTIQQGGSPGRSAGGGGGGDAEAEAKGAGELAARGGHAVVSAQASAGAPQFDLRNEVSSQRDKRGKDPAAGPTVDAPQSFSDMAKDDKGPAFHHDHGFLDDGKGNLDPSKRRDPTWGDRAALAKWIAKLELAEALRPDLVDGTAAYRHFLFGNGAARDVHYERFLQNDNGGKRVLASAMDDARDAVLRRHDADLAGKTPQPGTHSYHIRTDTIAVNAGNPRYPYPTTENWQKALGAHSIWIEATATVEVRAPAGTPANSCPAGGYERVLHIQMTIHEEDMYNFNPGAADIATGTPDADNGRFEVSGLGHEYLNRGTYSQAFDVTTSMAPAPATGTAGPAIDPGRAPSEGRAEGSRGRAAER
jgi:hypothetical protein